MCGIAGIVSPRRLAASGEGGLRALAESMTDALLHRGPDAGGVWADADNATALGHRRLSILDLSAAGAQPMRSEGGGWVVTYNGEIYNHPALRDELGGRGFAFRGSSDTEVLVNALEAWGIEATLQRLTGMFAFAALDRTSRRLYLARDRLGEKPLYYGRVGGEFLFASELKAITAVAGAALEIDRKALTLYLRHNYVPAPYSIYRDLRKLAPGHYLTLELGGSGTDTGVCRRYWDFAGGGSNDDGQGGLESLLRRSVRRQLVADVPVGAFLSGGVDSSTIVALATEESSLPLRTFTIGFEQSEFDEARHAEAVAAHLGTRHTTFRVTPDDAREVIPMLPRIYDEPFADSSQIPTYLVSRLTRSEVTVALSGDGGDELFAGYQRYAVAQRLWSKLDRFPALLRQAVPGTLGRLPTGVLGMSSRLLDALMPQPEGAFSASRLKRLLELAASRDADTLYRGLVSHELQPAQWVIDGGEPEYAFSAAERRCDGFVGRMMARDIESYLPDDILTKVDRASMAVSLEVRVPLLDHAIVEHAWRERPRQIDPRPGRSKWPLREILYRRVPRELIERPKSGFAVPLGDWLQGPLREWAGDLLSAETIRRQGLLDGDRVARMVAEHFTRRADHRYRLWNLLMLQSWLAGRESSASR